MKGKIAYRFETPAYPGDILYVNLIANYACINDCLFCFRPKNKNEIGKSIYEKKAGTLLFLPKPPSIDEIMDSIDSEIKKDDSELAIIGLGEPLIYFPKVVEVIRQVKSKYNIKTRIDTNGVVKNNYEDAAKQLKEAGLDDIRISVNAINEEEYNLLCRPKIKNGFSSMTSFVKDCIESKIETYASLVIGFDNGNIKSRVPEEYTEFALSLDVKKENIILRNYVKPGD